MYSKRTLARLVTLGISASLVVFLTIARVMGQNLPSPGAYQPIPNFTVVGAGVQFRKAINDRLSGAQWVAPASATVSFANLPSEPYGMLLFCKDCKLTSPCAGTGTGVWELGTRGQWSYSN